MPGLFFHDYNRDLFFCVSRTGLLWKSSLETKFVIRTRIYITHRGHIGDCEPFPFDSRC